MAPVKVEIAVLSDRHFISNVEYETLPNDKDIDLFLEFPAALILPLSLTLKPLQPMDSSSLVKKLLNR